MLAKLKADLAALKAKVLAAKDYVVAHYKQLLAAGLAGKFSSLLAGAVSAVVALVHKVI